MPGLVLRRHRLLVPLPSRLRRSPGMTGWRGARHTDDVMPGPDPGIHAIAAPVPGSCGVGVNVMAWMAGSSPAMTAVGCIGLCDIDSARSIIAASDTAPGYDSFFLPGPAFGRPRLFCPGRTFRSSSPLGAPQAKARGVAGARQASGGPGMVSGAEMGASRAPAAATFGTPLSALRTPDHREVAPWIPPGTSPGNGLPRARLAAALKVGHVPQPVVMPAGYSRRPPGPARVRYPGQSRRRSTPREPFGTGHDPRRAWTGASLREEFGRGIRWGDVPAGHRRAG
ncbi:hypothetical protein SAMN02982931_02996 [Bauldia litoralis]|uniref:Uncharacterized protein n=1 Tax=Bauldia litoralis TaxID=665467 RepID=A0A1G6D514_9HYPH|nr:hypothetical protein SAMN02982931_02996 [Bauldia litoralis]